MESYLSEKIEIINPCEFDVIYLEAQAKKDDPVSQYWLGMIYQFGYGLVKINVKKAFDLYEKSSKHGNADAICAFAQCYHYGWGTIKNHDKAIEYLELAKQHGNVYARVWLPHLKKQQPTPDVYNALKQIQDRAEKGDPLAMHRVGYCYDYGVFLEKSYDKAFYWYLKSSEIGHSAASEYNVGSCYSHGDGATKDSVKALEWFKRSADQGYANAQTTLGNIYLRGDNVVPDFRAAIRWYTLAAEQGNDNALNNLANRYLNGQGVQRNPEKAVEFYRQSVAYGNELAENNLGNCYYSGIGVEQDFKKAADLFLSSAKKGNNSAQTNLAMLYFKGEGVTKDSMKAFEWYYRASLQNNQRAKSELEKNPELVDIGKKLRNEYRWKLARLVWLGYLKNSKDECTLRVLPKEIIGEILKIALCTDIPIVNTESL